MTDTASDLRTAGARFVGSSVPRREDPRLLTGAGTFVDDVSVPGLLHVAFVRSPVARARVTSIDVTAALALDGVHAVYVADDLESLVRDATPTMYTAGPFAPNKPPTPFRPLAAGDVRYVGDPVVLVVADSRYLAEDAVELVEVDYEIEQPVLTIEDALTDERPVHPELGTNTMHHLPADGADEVDQAIAQAAHVVTRTISLQRQSPSPMETKGIVAQWDAHEGRLRIWMSTQVQHEVRLRVARLLGLPENRVEVEIGDVGGSFGQKWGQLREELAVVLAAVRLGRPVKWIEDRAESLTAGSGARDEDITITLAADDEGRLVAARASHRQNFGAYPIAHSLGGFLAMFFPTPYRFAGWACESVAVFTNTQGRGGYRGGWLMETLARELTIDSLARTMGIDPLELRRRNLVPQSELPWTTCTGVELDSVSFDETLEQAAHLVDYEGFRRRQAAARAEGRYLGIGFSLFAEPTSVGAGLLASDSASVRIEPDGTVTITMAESPHGQGHETTLAQVGADELGVDLADVVFRHAGTRGTPYSPGTGGSRTAVIGSNAVRQATAVVRDKVLRIAAELLEAAPDDLDIEGGVVSVRGTPSASVSLREVATVAYLDPDRLPAGLTPGLEGQGRFKAPPITWSNACHACTCEVDVQTGVVRLEKYVVSEDCGRMINPMIVEGQIMGGVMQGIAGALYEELPYDDAGNPLASTFMDYVIPTATESPGFIIGHVETPSSTPGGHKGMGEGGAIGSPAAVLNAVADALAPFGVEIPHGALGPSAVLDLLRAARR